MVYFDRLDQKLVCLNFLEKKTGMFGTVLDRKRKLSTQARYISSKRDRAWSQQNKISLKNIK